MRSRKLSGIALAVCAASMLVMGSMACSSSSSPAGGSDGGADSSAQGDSGSPQGDSGPQGDGGDGGCDFAAYVLGLIQNDTNGTAVPDTTLGAGCTDQQNQAQFSTLF